MKKIRIYLAFALLGTLFILTACKKESPRSCSELLNDYSAALTAFYTNPSEGSCNDFYDALHDYLDGCAALTAAERAQLEEDLDDVDCSIY